MPRLLTPELREILGRPLGTLVANDELKHARLREAVESSSLVVSVGDVTLRCLLEAGVLPHIYVVDNKEMRVRVEGVEAPYCTLITTRNPPGMISEDAEEAFERALRSERPVKVFVDGEEDLLALVAMVKSPPGAVVLYGQPFQGVVVVTLDENRERFLEIYASMVTQPSEKV